MAKRPKTVTEVIERLIWKNFHPGIAFYEGSKDCRVLKASLIRSTVSALLAQTSLPQDVHALVEAIDGKASDEALEAAWREAIDGLRVLFHASPIGTSRERGLLISVAKNPTLVAAMRIAAIDDPDVQPSWLAVFSAEGAPESIAIVDRHRPQLMADSKLLQAIDSFRGATTEPAPTAPIPSTVVSLRPRETLTRDKFWALIDEASANADPTVLICERLGCMTPRQIATFARHFDDAINEAYRYDLWGAAYLILGGCSDDSFMDFRSQLVTRGRTVFERVLADPDSLADDLYDIEGDESIANIAGEVYEEVTGKTLPSQYEAECLASPLGPEFDFGDQVEMRRRYPKLFARFTDE